MTGYCCTVRFCCKRPINQHLTPADVLAYLGFGKEGPWQARRARAYNGGLGAEPPAGSRGRAPGRGSGGRSPTEAETLFAFERSMKAANSPIFSEICWKTAKNATFHTKSLVKNFHGRAKGGHRTMPPLNTPLKRSYFEILA